jgi:DNA invertase Pin-like site-specific DNA recombinase
MGAPACRCVDSQSLDEYPDAHRQADVTVLGTLAQCEREMRLERQREGIAKAKAEGRYQGRKPIKAERRHSVLQLAAAGATRTVIATKLGSAKHRVSNSRLGERPESLTGLSVQLFQRP